MVPMTKWLDRRFTFDFPVGTYAFILARLRGTPARVEETVRPLTESILTARVNGEWSLKEHIGHLRDVEALHDGRIDDFLAGVETLRAADLSNTRTREANHNRKEIAVLVDSFRATRFAMLQRLEQMDEQLVSRSALHPRLNVPMRVADMAYFAAEHDDHHLAIMYDLIAQLQGK